MIRKFIKLLFLAVTILSMFLLLLSSLAWYVDPHRTIVFSLIGLAFPLILTSSIACLVLWSVLKKWKVVSVIILILIVSYKPVTTFFPINIKQQRPPEKSLKILSYNVMGFMRESKKESAHPLLEYIAKTDADIICLQEYMISKTGKSLLTQADVNKILNKYPYSSITGLESSGKYHIYGLACFSKFPITNTYEFKFESSYNGAAIYTLSINEETYLISNNHLESNRISSSDKQLYSDFLINRDYPKALEVSSNIKKRMQRAYTKRASQVQQISDYINQQEYDKLIVCGDFNDMPISYAYNKLKETLSDAYVATGFGPGITYHEHLFLFRIDYILHSKNLKAHKTRVDRVNYSDHYPILTYLTENEN